MWPRDAGQAVAMNAQYNWDFASIVANWDVLAHGLGVTVRLAASTLVVGLSLGLVMGMGRYARRWYINLPASAFVEVFRNVPALVVIIWFFFAFPIISPFEVDSFTAAFLAISFNTAAFSADIYRAGIQSISPHQWDGARALGMTYLMVMRRVILPQALKRIIPPLTSRGIEVIKLSTLASVIAVGELLDSARELSTIYFNPIESYTVVALIFFVLIYPLSQMTYRLERRLSRSD
jgi:polar amino acid transport system permease protein